MDPSNFDIANGLSKSTSKATNSVHFETPMGSQFECPSVIDEEIIWNENHKAYIHPSSGLYYSTVGKTFYAYVMDRADDTRALLYTSVGGVLKLTQEGEYGEENDETFKDMDWDRNCIFTENSKGYLPHLAKMFQAKLNEEEPEHNMYD